MSRSRREKTPDLVCGFEWGGTPELDVTDDGWKCPHYCRLTLAEHGDEHACCGDRVPV